MISRPDIGREGGQQYPIVKSIQMFLKQMAEGGAKPASTVFKELLQNADDAGATEVSVVLDERKPAPVFSDQYRHLCSPAIILRNNAPFRGRTEVADGEEDDFTAIRNVASGHKRADNTAAGRFGIGFNSVYFLTDTPVIFSRREVNLFDLLHKVIDINGWIFDLDDFPAGSKSSVGEIKTVLEWCLPKHALQEKSFGEIALEGDYQQAAFRLPFRNEDDSEEFLFDASFPGTEDRRQVLMEMAREAKRSIMFMKSVNTISFSILNENGPRLIAKTDVTPNPPEFVRVLEAIKKNQDLDRPVDFERIVTYSEDEKSSLRLRFHVWHSVCPSNKKLAELRRLLEGSDKAVPWVSIAVPLDRQSIQIDGGDGVSWRVFLPLLEPGPSYCLFSGAFFVGPGRQKMEYRVDQGTLKTEWNKALVEHALIELFRNITADLPSIASDLLDTDPKAYLSLFPSKPPEADPSSLTDYFKACFAKKEWWLSVRDIWDTEIELIVGDEATAITLEMIPEWLRSYKHCFEPLSDPSRRFITFALGSALRERLPEMSTVTVAREVSADVADSVLKSSSPPKVEDLRRLLDIALTAEDPAATIENAWAFVKSNDGSIIQYRANALYVLDIQADRDPVINHLRRLPLVFDNVEWVTEEALAKSWKRTNLDLNNVVLPNAKSAIELMHRLSKATGHDVLTQSSQIVPLVDFLITQEPAYLSGLMLSFLVRTAANKTSRRELGVVFLKPLQPTRDDEALWETWFRRLFAEIDPAFAKEINRLLAKHPHCLQMLSSDECQVVRAGHEIALNVLNRALKRSPELIDSLRKEINEHRSISDGLSDRISRSIIEYADRTWEDMNDEVKLTLIYLPIHRCADGRFVSLVDSIGPVDNFESRFRLQSEDDLRDAPIEIPAYILLNWRDSNTKNFYRNRLGIRVHDRVEVLSEVLRQIGTTDDQVRNRKLLNYILAYYSETVDDLLNSRDETDKNQVGHLRNDLVNASLIPCMDGRWSTARKCHQVTRVRQRLLEQKWPDKRILTLIPQLFEEYDIVSLIDGDDISFLLRKQRIDVDEIDLHQLYMHAITSNSRELSLTDRAKLITDNISDSAENKIAPSSTLYATLVPTVSGNKALKEAEILDSHSLASAAIRVIAPNAVDKMTLSRQLGLSERQAVRVLLACEIQEVSSEETKERVIKHFSELWPACRTNEDRFSVLQYVRTNNIADRLSETASRLDIVLVQQGKEKWKPPIGIVSPRLLLKKLPFLAEDERPSLSVSDDIKEVWHQWCGIGTVAQAFETLAGKAKSQTDIPKASKELYDWIDQVYPPAGAEQDEFDQKLATTAWVLAKRNGIEEVKLPRDIIIHKGHDVLERHFWVPAIPLPLSSRGHEREIGFQTNLEVNQYNLESVCICLSEALQAEPDGLLSIYARIADAVEEDADLRGLWTDYARQYRVFRTFRDNTPYVGSLQLFIGEVHREDLSSMLLCLCSDEGVPSKAPKLYEILGVPKQPTLKQILHALCTFEERDVGKAYRNLVDIVIKSATDEAVDYDWQNIKIRTCAGTFRPLGQSYWDPALGFKGHVQPASAQELIDTQHGDTRRLIDWIHQYDANYPKCLRDGPGVRFSGQRAPVDVAGSIDYVLQPWRHLCAEIVRADSRANEEVANRGLSITVRPPEFSVVERITLHSETVGEMSIDQDPKWEGPVAFADHNGEILIAAAYFPDNADLDAGRLKDIDSYIAEEILHSLGDTCFYKPDTERVQCLLNLLERPSTVIQALKERNRFHFIYQYQDQVADPDFTTLFDEYQKTRPSSGRHQELEEELYSILSRKFIDARREQIRGYGYEEFSVITELLQNAEDAYVQRAWLGMDMSEECEVTFRFEKQSTERTILNVEHKGRPFNYYRHQGKEDRAFARDVEGVLRSAGSYKPHTRIDEDNDDEGGSRNIGRFGLGFKSVFLLCDRPEIHSGHWHFAIENGCIPVEVPVPQNWNPSLTRITLPLNSGAEVGLEADRLAGLLPFLRQTKRISIVSSDGAEKTVAIKETMALESKEWVVQECFVEINSRPFLRFVRVRSGSAQMAMLIDSKNFPVRWDDSFPNDLCAFLPLKSRLGCGIGISNRFQVQSGRTHLTSSEDNEKLAINIAALLPGLTAWLSGPGYHQAKSGISAYLLRFWQIWNWNEYDAECEFIIDKIAYELWRLADSTEIVPTHDLDGAVSLSRGLCFYFVDVPVLFRQALLRDRFAVPVPEDEDIQLTAANVVPEVFVSSLRRLAEHIGCQIDDYMFRVSWEQIALACEKAPWLAEKPELLNDLASCLSDDRLDDVAGWVANCNVAGIDGVGKTGSWIPRQLFSRDMADADYLPTRFLQHIDRVYSDPALALLRKAGLKTQPSSDDISVWITKGQLDSKECNGLLRYLASQDRFRVFWSLRGLFCSAWICSNGDRITPEQARRKGLLDPDVISNNVFGAWLGLETGEVLEPPPASPRYNPEVILGKLADEWEKHGSQWVKLYNQKVYPNGLPPALLFSDAGMTTSERREWMVLLILGSLHTMGRTKPEQHRDFLMRCSRNGWLDAISEQNTDTRRWFDFIESFLDDPLGNQDYYQWVKQIVAFYQFNRWLPEYVGVLSAIDRFNRPLTVNDIFNPRENPDLSGSGLDAPSMRRALGVIGVHFVLRELVRLDLLEGRNVSHLCYVPVRRVRKLLSTITNGGAYDSSNEIHQLLVEVLGRERATFGKAFDLPLLVLSDDQKLQRDIIGKEIDFDPSEE